MTKPIVIQDRMNQRFKLTVAAGEVRIKMADGSSEEERAEIVKFFTAVAARSEIQNCDRTLRGYVASRANTSSSNMLNKLQLTSDTKKRYRFNFNRLDYAE
jgi:hypothetical protein